MRSRMLTMLFTFIFTLFICLAFAESGIDAYQRYSRDRWDKIYAKLLTENFHTKLVDSNHLVKIHGFPEDDNTMVIHSQGNPIEAAHDSVKILEYVDRLVNECAGPSAVHFKVLSGSASPEFYSTLQSLGYHDVELSTIMSLDSIDELIAQRPLAEGYKMSRATTESELIRFAEFHGSMIQWAIMKIRQDPPENLLFLQIIDESSGELACTLLVEIVDGIAGIQMVETSPAHRRKGLASALMHEAVSSAFKDYGVKTVVLGATPMAVSLYSHLGFKTHGQYHSYEYDL